MSEKQETFADTVIREALRSKRKRRIPGWFAAAIGNCRRFVLDEGASRFLSDLSHANFCGVNKAKQIRALETSRVLARLPHKRTWIEYDGRAFRARTLEAYGDWTYGTVNRTDDALFNGMALCPPDQVCPRMGWMLGEEVEGIVTAYIFADTTGSGNENGGPFLCPFALYWKTEGEPFLFAGEKAEAWEKMQDCMQIMMGIRGYRSAHVCATAIDTAYEFNSKQFYRVLVEVAGELRYMLTLLAAINDVPIGARVIRPSHGYVAQGRYRKFVEHTVISLVLPKGRTAVQVARKAIAMARRRAHQVRGHWRRDWRHYGERIWVHEHQRGDPKLGFVVHDYNVQHEEEHHGR